MECLDPARGPDPPMSDASVPRGQPHLHNDASEKVNVIDRASMIARDGMTSSFVVPPEDPLILLDSSICIRTSPAESAPCNILVSANEVLLFHRDIGEDQPSICRRRKRNLSPPVPVCSCESTSKATILNLTARDGKTYGPRASRPGIKACLTQVSWTCYNRGLISQLWRLRNEDHELLSQAVEEAMMFSCSRHMGMMLMESTSLLRL